MSKALNSVRADESSVTRGERELEGAGPHRAGPVPVAGHRVDDEQQRLLGAPPEEHHRVVMMGGARVGKSSIISQFLYDKFLSRYRETVEELHRGVSGRFKSAERPRHAAACHKIRRQFDVKFEISDSKSICYETFVIFQSLSDLILPMFELWTIILPCAQPQLHNLRKKFAFFQDSRFKRDTTAQVNISLEESFHLIPAKHGPRFRAQVEESTRSIKADVYQHEKNVNVNTPIVIKWLESSSRHMCEYELPDGASLTLDILDTSGAYQFPAMRDLSISTADAFILVYSVDSKESWDQVRDLRQLVSTPPRPLPAARRPGTSGPGKLRRVSRRAVKNRAPLRNAAPG
ncbi:unnamed protein product [Bemisia tabaci]|uniref:Uncharacterized protein n=1 Tax=Bemisia tabaci TaxID=7038 RepID=A0A9P0F595_BEMTA|nr:unnamed protein product [Bemisia tabaci]